MIHGFYLVYAKMKLTYSLDSYWGHGYLTTLINLLSLVTVSFHYV